MHPILFEAGSISIYSYGLLIALGVVAGMFYLIKQGGREVGLKFDQANTLFLWIFFAAVVGGKLLLFFEDPSHYLDQPGALLSGAGFVFYGSFLAAIPVMWWFFKKENLPILTMLDIMAVTTCLVHIFGRLGCFMAGCCYGKPTEAFTAVVFTHAESSAPLEVPLHPTQLYEAGYIALVLIFLLWLRPRRRFHGQLFISYLLLYAVGRIFLEFFRGDAARGLLLNGMLSHSQLVAIVVIIVVTTIYVTMLRRHVAN